MESLPWVPLSPFPPLFYAFPSPLLLLHSIAWALTHFPPSFFPPQGSEGFFKTPSPIRPSPHPSALLAPTKKMGSSLARYKTFIQFFNPTLLRRKLFATSMFVLLYKGIYLTYELPERKKLSNVTKNCFLFISSHNKGKTLVGCMPFLGRLLFDESICRKKVPSTLPNDEKYFLSTLPFDEKNQTMI